MPHDSEYEEVCGITSKTKLVIVIGYKISDELLRRTIVHELVHAYIWSYGLENSTPFTEEQICNFFETHYKSILDNADKINKEALKVKNKAKKTKA